MKVAAYDMYIQNYHMNAVAWSKISTDYPNVKIKTLPKNVNQCNEKSK